MTHAIITGETVSIILFFIGVYGICARRNILKTIISLSIIQVSIILFFISMNEDTHQVPKGNDVYLSHYMNSLSDPIPQALMITAIVIGISVTALCLTLFVSLYHKHGTTNWKRLLDRRGDHTL